MNTQISLLLVAMAAAVGCGGVELPHAGLSEAKAAVRAAQEVKADRYPTASAHLKFAQDQIAEAVKLMAEDDDETNAAAAQILKRAELDAEVAVRRAKAEQMRDRARLAQERVQNLAHDNGQARLEED